MSNLEKKQTLKSMLSNESIQNRLKEVIGKNTGVFTTSVLQIAQSNDMLKNAEPSTIIGAAMTAATLDLPLNNSLGFAYIVPFYDNKTRTTKAQFQIGAKGFKQLAIRSGQFKTLHDTDVREGEIKHVNRLTGVMEFDFIQDDKERLSRKIVGYVSYFELTNGFSSTFYMTIEELENHAKNYSQTYKKGFGTWKDNFDAMARKTVTKLNLSKNAPLSIEMQKAVTFDQVVVNETEDVSYIDNQDVEEVEDNSLSNEDFLLLVKSVQDGNITVVDAANDFDLTDEQLKSLENVENKK
jgi:recombination protein RecT